MSKGFTKDQIAGSTELDPKTNLPKEGADNNNVGSFSSGQIQEGNIQAAKADNTYLGKGRIT